MNRSLIYILGIIPFAYVNERYKSYFSDAEFVFLSINYFLLMNWLANSFAKIPDKAVAFNAKAEKELVVSALLIGILQLLGFVLYSAISNHLDFLSRQNINESCKFASLFIAIYLGVTVTRANKRLNYKISAKAAMIGTIFSLILYSIFSWQSLSTELVRMLCSQILGWGLLFLVTKKTEIK